MTAPKTAHRKDNSEWGKGMEKELTQIEKKQQAKVQSKPDTVTPSLDLNSDSEEDSLPIAQTILATRAGTARYCQYRSSTGSFCFDF